MVQGSTRINLYENEYKLIKAEAEKLVVPMSKILKDYALGYLKLKNETEAAKFGEALEGTTIHTVITKMEARIAVALEENSQVIIKNSLGIKNFESEMQIIAVLIDNFIKLYLNHTLEVPINDREERSKSSLVRYQRFLLAVKSNLKDSNSNVINNIQQSILLDLET